MSTRILRYGPHAWLVEHADPAGVAAAVRAAAPVGVADVVPGAATTLIELASWADADAAGRWLADLLEAVPATPAPPVPDEVGSLEIPVVYDGEDLSAVADASGLSVDDVIDRHHRASYRCAFCGFAPGFGYLVGLDPALHLPRRASPRPRIPAGSVAIASRYTAIYPTSSPGGWHLIGRSDMALWRAERQPPALITPGTVVRFVAVDR